MRIKKYQLKNHNLDNEKIKVYATIELKRENLKVEYEIVGDVSDYHFPKESQQKRANELWKDTCFELFIANASSKEYYEINISPSTEWNAYHFKSYKEEMKESDALFPPFIQTQHLLNRCIFSFQMSFQESILEKELELNLALILLDNQGIRHFYAINRRKEFPDFHDRGYYNFLKNQTAT